MEIGNVVHGEKGTVRISNSYTAAAFFDRDGRMVEEWKVAPSWDSAPDEDWGDVDEPF
jgi:hypothetical protein